MSVVQYKCPNCGGGLIFDAVKQDFICEYCDSVFKEQDFFGSDRKLDSEMSDQENTSEYENALLYSCPSCGAEIITDETTAATTCYYCSNPVVLSGKLSGALKPDYIIPFKIDKKTAIDKFKSFCGKKKFLPKNFLSDSRLEEIKGVYFPYWYIDCDANGSLNATSTQIRSWIVGDIKYTETTIMGHFRQGNMKIRNMPETALKSKDRDLMKYVCPFDCVDFVPFSMSYLSGYFAEKRDIEKDEIFQQSVDKIKSYSAEKLKSSINSTGINIKNSQINVGESQWRYNLLPVWVLNYKHGDKNYIYALNGQTGSLYGELPVSKKKLATLFAAVAGVSAVLLTLAEVIFL